MSAEDARYLAPELGRDLEVDDLVSLDDYERYARWSSSGHHHPAFSLRLNPPAPVDSSRIAAIAERSAERFGSPREEVAGEVDRVIAVRASRVAKESRAATTTSSKPDNGGQLQLSLTTEPPPKPRSQRGRRRSS